MNVSCLDKATIIVSHWLNAYDFQLELANCCLINSPNDTGLKPNHRVEISKNLSAKFRHIGIFP